MSKVKLDDNQVTFFSYYENISQLPPMWNQKSMARTLVYSKEIAYTYIFSFWSFLAFLLAIKKNWLYNLMRIEEDARTRTNVLLAATIPSSKSVGQFF